MTDQLLERNAKIQAFREKHPDATPGEIAKHFGISRHAVRRAIIRIDRALDVLGSKGIGNAASSLGVMGEHIHSGWIKNGEASIYFRAPDANVEEENDIFIETIREVFSEGYVPRGSTIAPSAGATNPDLLTKYVIADYHLGMKAWAEECGTAYNLEIAETNLIDAINIMVDTSPAAEKAIILNLGDFFHANDSKNRTPMSGHILDVDGRFAEIAKVGIRVMREVIYAALKKHDYVEYISVPGNHDIDQNHWLTIALSEHFSHNPRVKFNHIGANFRIVQHGKCLLGFHHGHGIKFDKMALAMAAFEPKLWGETVFRYADTGHIHHKKEEEFAGVTVRSHRAMAAADAYSNSHLYNSGRGMSSATYHKTRGEIQLNHVNFYKGNPV